MVNDFFLTLYPWIKALHVIAVISWMAGLLYLPRLFVHHAEKAKIGSETSEIFKVMEDKLYRVIMNPAMMVTWVCGLTMIFTPNAIDLLEIWTWIKFIAVLSLTGFHLWLKTCLIKFSEDKNQISGRSYRIMNEVPTALMLIIVVMVIVRPF